MTKRAAKPLGVELAELEARNPAVRRAARNLENVTDAIAARPVPAPHFLNVRALRRMGSELIALSGRLSRRGRHAISAQEATEQRCAEDPEFAAIYANAGANMRWSEALAAYGIFTPSEVEDDDKKLRRFLGRKLRGLLIEAAAAARESPRHDVGEVVDRVIACEKARRG